MVKGGPYWHVIRFLDHPLLPAKSRPDVPKIVKHGINDDGPMHPRSPHISAVDGAATLMHLMGQEKWLKRFLDVGGTYEFGLVMRQEPFQDLYITRKGVDVEIGFISTSRTSIPEPGAGVRYRVSPSGEWVPISTSDMGSEWGGSLIWVRGQGESIGKAFWYHHRWLGSSVLSIDWTGMTDAEKEENRVWCEEFEKAAALRRLQHVEVSQRDEEKEWERLLDASKKECRGGCGEKNSKLVCSRCKETCYCSHECQKEDWKYHKSVCGLGSL